MYKLRRGTAHQDGVKGIGPLGIGSVRRRFMERCLGAWQPQRQGRWLNVDFKGIMDAEPNACPQATWVTSCRGRASKRTQGESKEGVAASIQETQAEARDEGVRRF